MVDYEDDRNIPDEDVVLRRVPGLWIRRDPVTGAPTVSSGAFQNRKESGAMSVGLLSEIRQRGRDPLVMLEGMGPEYGLVSLTVGQLRVQGQGVVRAPTDPEPWHALVLGPKPKSVQAAFKLDCTWVRHPSA